LKITKSKYDASGKVEQVPKIIEIPVKRGYRAGTKLTYEREGDERPGEIPADIIFEIAGESNTTAAAHATSRDELQLQRHAL
jgi:DnaJ-class molecular chaperone